MRPVQFYFEKKHLRKLESIQLNFFFARMKWKIKFQQFLNPSVETCPRKDSNSIGNRSFEFDRWRPLQEKLYPPGSANFADKSKRLECLADLKKMLEILPLHRKLDKLKIRFNIIRFRRKKGQLCSLLKLWSRSMRSQVNTTLTSFTFHRSYVNV